MLKALCLLLRFSSLNFRSKHRFSESRYWISHPFYRKVPKKQFVVKLLHYDPNNSALYSSTIASKIDSGISSMLKALCLLLRFSLLNFRSKHRFSESRYWIAHPFYRKVPKKQFVVKLLHYDPNNSVLYSSTIASKIDSGISSN